MRVRETSGRAVKRTVREDFEGLAYFVELLRGGFHVSGVFDWVVLERELAEPRAGGLGWVSTLCRSPPWRRLA